MPKSVLLLQLMDLLREHPGLTISELAAELGKSERTIYRYLELMSMKLHLQVYRYNGGYYLTENALPNRLNLSPKEILAVRLSLISSSAQGSGSLVDYAKSAWRKIETALTSDDVDAVQDTVMKHVIYAPSSSKSKAGFNVMKCIANAVELNKRLSILYVPQRNEETKILVIDPYALIFRRHNWYLIAYSYLHGHMIQLKLSKIIKATETGEVFQLPEEFSVESFYVKNWEMWAGREKQLVKVKFTPKVARIVRESKLHPTQVLEDTSDGGVILSIEAAGIEEIVFWILSWGVDAEVLEPAELRSSIVESAVQLLAIYSETTVDESKDGKSSTSPKGCRDNKSRII